MHDDPFETQFADLIFDEKGRIPLVDGQAHLAGELRDRLDKAMRELTLTRIARGGLRADDFEKAIVAIGIGIDHGDVEGRPVVALVTTDDRGQLYIIPTNSKTTTASTAAMKAQISKLRSEIIAIDEPVSLDIAVTHWDPPDDKPKKKRPQKGPPPSGKWWNR